VLHDTNSLSTYPFSWVKEYDTYILGQITVPSSFSFSTLQTTGIKVSIPYTPIYKPIRIQFVKQYGDVKNMEMFNPVSRNYMFELRTKLYGLQNTTLRASQLYMVSQEDYIITISRYIAYVWSASSSDLINTVANIQNRNLMLQCVPSNNYRYPTSGVGLVRYLHSPISQTGLADRLKSEFSSDKVTVNSAAFDSDTGNLEMDLDFTEADASV
jgi:dynactin complex subunit